MKANNREESNQQRGAFKSPFFILRQQVLMMIDANRIYSSLPLTNIIFLGQLTSQLKKMPVGTRIKDIVFDKEKLKLHLII